VNGICWTPGCDACSWHKGSEELRNRTQRKGQPSAPASESARSPNFQHLWRQRYCVPPLSHAASRCQRRARPARHADTAPQSSLQTGATDKFPPAAAARTEAPHAREIVLPRAGGGTRQSRSQDSKPQELTLSCEPGASESLSTHARSLRSAAKSAESSRPTRQTTNVAPGRSIRAAHQPSRSLAVTSCARHKAAARNINCATCTAHRGLLPHLPAELRRVFELDSNHGTTRRRARSARGKQRVLPTPDQHRDFSKSPQPILVLLQ